MRDNFRPNVRLATNILMVIGTFLIAINLASVGNQDKEFRQRRDDCADTIGGRRSPQYMIDKYKLGGEFIKNRYLQELSKEKKSEILTKFCSFYLMGEYPN